MKNERLEARLRSRSKSRSRLLAPQLPLTRYPFYKPTLHVCLHKNLWLVTRNIRFPPLDQTFYQTRSSPLFSSRAPEVYFYTADVRQGLERMDTRRACVDVDVDVDVDIGVGVGVSYMHGRVHTLIIARHVRTLRWPE